jgi:hypothetical protein
MYVIYLEGRRLPGALPNFKGVMCIQNFPKFCGNKNTRFPTSSEDAMLALLYCQGICVNYIDQEGW